MKTTKAITYSPAGTLLTFDIPAGLPVDVAANLPDDSRIKYWLSGLTPEMEADDRIEGWFRNYGIGLAEADVTGE